MTWMREEFGLLRLLENRIAASVDYANSTAPILRYAHGERSR